MGNDFSSRGTPSYRPDSFFFPAREGLKGILLQSKKSEAKFFLKTLYNLVLHI